jgi:hypothetical protein
MQVEFEYKRSKLNLNNENKSNSSNGAARRLPKPMLACENFGRNSAPRLPQRLQVKFGSMSESRTSSGQPSALVSRLMAATVIPAVDQDVAHAGCAHFAEGDFNGVGHH